MGEKRTDSGIDADAASHCSSAFTDSTSGRTSTLSEAANGACGCDS